MFSELHDATRCMIDRTHRNSSHAHLMHQPRHQQILHIYPFHHQTPGAVPTCTGHPNTKRSRVLLARAAHPSQLLARLLRQRGYGAVVEPLRQPTRGPAPNAAICFACASPASCISAPHSRVAPHSYVKVSLEPASVIELTRRARRVRAKSPPQRPSAIKAALAAAGTTNIQTHSW